MAGVRPRGLIPGLPVVNLASPLLKGLSFLCVSGPGLQAPRNLIGQAGIAAKGSAVVLVSDAPGLVWKFGTTSNDFLNFGTFSPVNGAGNFTALVYANPISATPAAAQRACAARNTSTSTQSCGLSFNSSKGTIGTGPVVAAGKVSFVNVQATGSVYLAADTAAILPAYPIYQSFIGIRRGSNPEIWVNGLNQTSTTTTGSATFSDASQTWYIGNVPAGFSAGANCNIALCATWNRDLSVSEILALNDPLRTLFAQTVRPRKYWAKASAATAKLRWNSNLNGLGASGPFFHDRLAL